METREKQRLIIRTNYKFSFWVQRAVSQAALGWWAWSIFGWWRKDREWWPNDVLFVVWMSLVMASGVAVNFLRDLHSSRHEGFPYMICWDFFEIYIKSSGFSLQGFRKRALLVFSMPSQEGGKKIGNMNYWQNARDGRSQFTKRKKAPSQWTWHPSMAHKVWL